MNDSLFQGAGGGSVAQKLLASNFKINALRTNASLRKDEWELLDSVIVQVARIRLRAVADLMTRGLVYRVNGMRTSVLQWQTQSKTQEVFTSMDPQVRGNNEQVIFGLENLPLPIFHTDYQLGARKLETSRNGGQPLDTILAQQASLNIAEKVEDTYVNGLGNYTYGNGTIYGLTDHPNRKTVVLGTPWTDPLVTGEDILQQVCEMKQELINSKKYGPYVLYIPTAYETKMDKDFKTDGDLTIRERILQLSNVEAVTVVDSLPNNNVILLQLTADNVQMVEGMPMNNVQWDTNAGMSLHFKVMTIMVPRFFVDQDGNLGVCHLS